MIATLEGTVLLKGAEELVLSVGGVGFQICATEAVLRGAKVGESLFLYTRLVVREDSFDLYGFADREEKEMFLKLTAVSGVGPKSAMVLLSSLGVHDLALAVVTGDIKAIRKAPGIGVKTAQRLLLELKDKVSNEELVGADISGAVVGTNRTSAAAGPAADAIDALCALGYSQAEAVQAVSRFEAQTQDSGELTRLALRALSRF